MKSRRGNFTISFKIRALQLLTEYNGNVSKTSKELGIHRKNVQRWRLNREALEKQKLSQSSCTRVSRRVKRLQSGRLPNRETRLLNWVRHERRKENAVHCKGIRQKAAEFYREMDVATPFIASKGLVYRFMKRHALVNRAVTSMGQQLPVNSKALAIDFLLDIQPLFINYPLHAIANMDEVPVYFDMPNNSTVDLKGLHTIKVRTTGNEHLRFTVVLTAMSNGKKLMPMIIFKNLVKKPNEVFPQGIHIAASKGGSMSAHLLSTEYLPGVWNKRPGAIFMTPGAMIWDQHTSHKDATIVGLMRTRYHTDIQLIPAGMTPLLQPLDVGVNKAFKNTLRSKWETWMSEGDVELTRGGRRKRASYGMIAEWVLEAWQGIGRETLLRAFSCCGFQKGGTPYEQLHSRLCSLVRDGEIPDPAEVLDITTSDEAISDTEE